MAAYMYDLFVIGGGSGGVRGSRMAASYGAKVALCELPYSTVSSDTRGGMGGTCVIRGCVPKKLLVYGSEFSHTFRDAAGLGWATRSAPMPEHSWATLMENKNKELERLNGVYKRIVGGAGVEHIEGRGKLLDAHTVEVSTAEGPRVITTQNVLIATGGRAWRPDFPGVEHTITSDEALDLKELPRRIVVVGGGYIGIEMACVFKGYGSDTHYFFRGDAPLAGFDRECREFVAEQVEKVHGVTMHRNCAPLSCERQADGRLTYRFKRTDGTEGEVRDVDQVLMATGRKPNSANLGLEAAGVQTNPESGAILVDDYMRTNVPNIYAVGDVVDKIALTPVALMEGMSVAKTLFLNGGTPTKPDHSNVASAVFSQPPLATVGMTEEQAVAAVGDVDVYTSSFRPMKNTISGSEGRALMKLLVDAKSGKLLGCHMVGPDSAEIMQGMAVAVKMGCTKEQLDSVVGIHPSSAEEFVTMRSVTRRWRDGKQLSN